MLYNNFNNGCGCGCNSGCGCGCNGGFGSGCNWGNGFLGLSCGCITELIILAALFQLFGAWGCGFGGGCGCNCNNLATV